jgi:hypothetical protein
MKMTASASRQRHPAPGPTRSSRPAGTLPVSACRRPYDSRENMDVLGDCSPRPSPRLAVSVAGRPRSVPFGSDARQISAGAATRLVTADHASTRVYLRLKGPRRPPPPKAVRLRALRGRPRSMPTRDPSHPHHHGHPHSSTVLMHVPAPSLSSIAHVFPLVLAPDSAPCRAPY